MNQSSYYRCLAWEVKWKAKKIFRVVFIGLRTFPSFYSKKFKIFHLRRKALDAHGEMGPTELLSITGLHMSVNYSYVSTQDQVHTLVINQRTSDLL